MAIEIERKFLVTSDAWKDGAEAVEFRQGYLSREKGRTVRIRVAGKRGFVTIKGASKGFARAEYEYEIPALDAEEMLGLCEGPLIEKVRHHVHFAGFLWEVDEFRGDNAGLIVAEIELPSVGTEFELPEWVGKEVTSDSRYANSRLSLAPYSTWKKPSRKRSDA